MANENYYYETFLNNLNKNAAKLPQDYSVYGSLVGSTSFNFKNAGFKDVKNYLYVSPVSAADNYGGWGDYNLHGIVPEYYYKKNNTDTQCKFVDKRSAPFPRYTGWSTAWASLLPVAHNSCAYQSFLGQAVTIYWNNSEGVVTSVFDMSHRSTSDIVVTNPGFGVFIFIAGAGGGGGGGDAQYWWQGSPGGGGGGGGSTALIYFDAKVAYDMYGSAGTYMYIQLGAGGSGGSGGSSFGSGSKGGDTVAKFYGGGNLLATITAGGGSGGDGCAWDVSSASGGGGGSVTQSYSNDSIKKIVYVLGTCRGGQGGTGYRGSSGTKGYDVPHNSYNWWRSPVGFPYYLWYKYEEFNYGGKTYTVGKGTPGNGPGGGRGACCAGYNDPDYPLSYGGAGYGGYGGGESQSGSNGSGGYCAILRNYIPGDDIDAYVSSGD